jgi:hypothetical protein
MVWYIMIFGGSALRASSYVFKRLGRQDGHEVSSVSSSTLCQDNTCML